MKRVKGSVEAEIRVENDGTVVLPASLLHELDTTLFRQKSSRISKD